MNPMWDESSCMARRAVAAVLAWLPTGQTQPVDRTAVDADYQKVLIERLLDAKPGDVIEIPGRHASPSTAA